RLGLLNLLVGDSDPERHLLLLAVHEDRQVSMDVEQCLLVGLALNPVDGLSRDARRARPRRRRVAALRDRHHNERDNGEDDNYPGRQQPTREARVSPRWPLLTW